MLGTFKFYTLATMSHLVKRPVVQHSFELDLYYSFSHTFGPWFSLICRLKTLLQLKQSHTHLFSASNKYKDIIISSVIEDQTCQMICFIRILIVFETSNSNIPIYIQLWSFLQIKNWYFFTFAWKSGKQASTQRNDPKKRRRQIPWNFVHRPLKHRDLGHLAKC